MNSKSLASLGEELGGLAGTAFKGFKFPGFL
jgi:hypothetical protein